MVTSIISMCGLEVCWRRVKKDLENSFLLLLKTNFDGFVMQTDFGLKIRTTGMKYRNNIEEYT